MDISLKRSREARDEGIDRVSRRKFMDDALEAIKHLPSRNYTGEDIRVTLTREHGLKPHHHNAWGAVILNAVRKNILTEVGASQAHVISSHARRLILYFKPA